LRKIFLSTAILFIAIFASCVSQDLVESSIRELLPDGIDTFARTYIAMISEGKFEEADSLLGEELQNPGAKQTLRLLQGLLNAGHVESTELINLKIMKMNIDDKTRYYLEYYVQYNITEESLSEEILEQLKSEKEKHLVLDQDARKEKDAKLHQVLSIVIDDRPDRKSIVGFHVQMIPKSIKELNDFSLVNIDLSRQAFLILWILVPLFSIYVAVLCLRTKVRLKFLWFLFIIIGVGKLTLNWSTGNLTTYPLAVQLLGASYFRPGLYGPWLFSVSWPLGAMIFYFRRKKLQIASMKIEGASDTADVSQVSEYQSDESALGGNGEDEKQQELDLKS
jgi:hypothetical protein